MGNGKVSEEQEERNELIKWLLGSKENRDTKL